MTWWSWTLLGIFVADTLACLWDIMEWGEVDAWKGWLWYLLLVAGMVLAVALVPSGPPEKPTRTCLVQQLQTVHHGKVADDEWVCIGWSAQ